MAEVQIGSGNQNTPPPSSFLDFSQASMYRLELTFPIDLPQWLIGRLDGVNIGGVNVHAYLSEPHTLELEFTRS